MVLGLGLDVLIAWTMASGDKKKKESGEVPVTLKVVRIISY